MGTGIRVEKGSMLFWRLGNLRMGPQARWDRAPEKKGLWAFPWPYYETFFTYHKYLDALPKHLQDDNFHVPLDKSWVRDLEGNPVEEILRDEEGWLDIDRQEVSEDFQAAREAWIKKQGATAVPLKKFWFEGELYCHFSRGGAILGLDEWQRMAVADYAKLIVKTRGNRVGVNHDGKYLIMRSSVDHMEVFIPQDQVRHLH